MKDLVHRKSIKTLVITFYCTILSYFPYSYSANAKSQPIPWPKFPPENANYLKILKNGNIISQAKCRVLNDGEQELEFKTLGIHPKSCKIVLPYIAQYSFYSNWLPFVTKSSYNPKTEILGLHLDSILLPYKFLLRINLPQIKKVGQYDFFLPDGIFAKLKGHVVILDKKNQCWIGIYGRWTGTDTKIPSTMIEIFVQTLMYKSMENIIKRTNY